MEDPWLACRAVQRVLRAEWFVRPLRLLCCVWFPVRGLGRSNLLDDFFLLEPVCPGIPLVS